MPYMKPFRDNIAKCLYSNVKIDMLDSFFFKYLWDKRMKKKEEYSINFVNFVFWHVCQDSIRDLYLNVYFPSSPTTR